MKKEKTSLSAEHYTAREILLNVILRLFPNLRQYVGQLENAKNTSRDGSVLRIALFGCLMKTNCCCLTLKEIAVLMGNQPKGNNYHSQIIYWKHVIDGTVGYNPKRRKRILDTIDAVERNVSQEYLASLVSTDCVLPAKKFDGQTYFSESDPEGYRSDVVLAALMFDDTGQLITKKQHDILKGNIESERAKFVLKFKNHLSPYYVTEKIIPTSVIVDTVEQSLSPVRNEYVQGVREILLGTALFPAYLL